MVRSWVKLIWNSLGVAVVATAAQLGVAEALGIVRWDESFQNGNGSGWSALLTWVAFIYAVSVLGGAAVGRRAVRRPTRPDTVPARITAALTAAVGATAAIALAWLPARTAQPPVSVHPELVAAMTAGAGVVAGLVIALVALSVPPVAGGVRAAVAWIWLAGIGSAIAGIAGADQTAADPAPRLAMIDAPSVIPDGWWSGPYVMVGVAAALGVVVAMMARWAGAHRLGIAVSGLAGPIAVAAAYLIAGQGTGVDAIRQFEPYRASLIAIGIGLVASAIVAIPAARVRPASASTRRRAGRRSEDRYATDDRHSAEDRYPAEDRYATEDRYGEGGGSAHGYAPSGHAASYPADHHPVEPRHAEVHRGTASPARPAPAPIMGQPPPPSFQEGYTDWLRDLGHVPTQRASAENPAGR